MLPFLKTPDINYREIFAKGKAFTISKFQELYQNALIARVKSKDLAGTNYQLGLLHMSQRHISDAILRFHLTNLLRPNHLLANYQLGRCYVIIGQYAKASKAFHKVLALKPGYPEALYYLAVLGETSQPDTLPVTIVEEHFDTIAPYYNNNILNELFYTGHILIAAKLAELLPASEEPAAWKVLDLGCGTGLCGSELKKHMPAATLTGIDISANMLAESSKLFAGGSLIYQLTEKKSIDAFLEEKIGTYDIIISGMALHYVGDLQPVFEKAHPMLTSNGIFVFTVQHSENNGFSLTSDMKNFAYSESYIRETAEATGFKVIDITLQPLYEGLPGVLCILEINP